MNSEYFGNIHVNIRKSTRTKRMTLRVSSLDGRVSLTVPSQIKAAEIELFLRDNKDWLKKKFQKFQQKCASLLAREFLFEVAY